MSVQVIINIEIVEDLFYESPTTNNYEGCRTLLGEIKHAMECSIKKNLLEYRLVSLQDAFDNALDDLINIDEISQISQLSE